MITAVTQRWRDQRGYYRPAGESLATSRHEVAPISDDRTAKAFVCRHHYAGSYPAARFRFGFYMGAELVGVAVFSHPASNRVLAVFGGEPLESVELGRFVLLDRVPGNGETWFLARCFEQLRHEGLRGVVSFSDPFPRTDAGGAEVFRGHIGTIYQAHNAIYLGRARKDTMRLLPDGGVLHSRTIAKIRGRDQGWRYAAALLERHGAAPLGSAEDARAWLARWVPVLTRKVRHPGNHRYVWGLTSAQMRRLLPKAKSYPKFEIVAGGDARGRTR